MRLIDADKLLARYKELCAGCKETKNYCEHCCDIADIISDIEDAPTVDVAERKKGKRMTVENPNYSPFDLSSEKISVCSVCGYAREQHDFNYCPNCGADMRGE